MIHLQPLTSKNWEACANLEVKKGQEDNLPSNLYSIAELQFYPQTKAFAIVNTEDTVVGFASYGVPTDNSAPKIFRLMIGKQFQNQGYGKAALVALVQNIFSETDSKEIQVCYHPKNTALTKFYNSVGFEEKEILESKRNAFGKRLAVLEKKHFSEIPSPTRGG